MPTPRESKGNVIVEYVMEFMGEAMPDLPQVRLLVQTERRPRRRRCQSAKRISEISKRGKGRWTLG